MSKPRSIIEQHLDCACEYFPPGEEAAVLTRFGELQAQGRQGGFWPLMVGVSGVLAEGLGFAREDMPYSTMAAAAARLEGKQVLERLGVQALETFGRDAVLGEPVASGERMDQVGVSLRMGQEGTLIAKLPCEQPWELALRVPMGGFNDCPQPTEQAAVFRYWQEKYGAVPALVTYDVWELAVDRPPQTDEEAMALAWEQFYFCQDIVLQGLETVSALAASLKNSRAWYFWWD